MYPKFKKCEFFKKEIQCLGHSISKKGIAVDPQKIKSILESHVPKDVAEIWSFMGLVEYYWRFIQGFSKIAYPITSLQRKGVKFVSCVKCQENFKNFKRLLNMAPIVRVVDPYKYYTICTDSRKEVFGGVLFLEGHVVC